VALYLANKYPKRVDGLMMEAGISSRYSTEGMLDGLARLFFIRGIDDLTGWLTAIFMNIAFMQRIDTIPVDRITFPTLLIYSRMDHDVKWHHAEYLRDNIPQAELLDVHGGHFMWVGKDMEKIKDKRVEFLNSLYKRK
jgi:pimeloyl-ACP methyl ester carboxylesterase